MAGFSLREITTNSALPLSDNCEMPVQAENFSVVSYNILADCHCQRNDYSYTSNQFLEQDYRHRLLTKELVYLDGDVVCLQEVGPEYYHCMLLPFMQSIGYDGVFKCRTKEFYKEGEASFFKKSVFELELYKGVSLTSSAVVETESARLHLEVRTAICTHLDKADVVLVTRLRCRKTGKIVTVGNVHIWWENDEHQDIKCVQAVCAIREVISLAKDDSAYIVCGDFNSDPSSPVYELVTTGQLCQSSVQMLQSLQHLVLGNGTQTSLMEEFESIFHHHAQVLCSVYSAVLGKEPEMTCFTDRPWILDYIFFNPRSLFVNSIFTPVPSALVRATGGLPSKDFPSDHLSLKAAFTFL